MPYITFMEISANLTFPKYRKDVILITFAGMISNGQMVKLIIVSNRLPITIKKVDGVLTATPSNGGLSSALSGIQTPFIWVGWPGYSTSDPTEINEIETMMEKNHSHLKPLFMTKEQEYGFYDRISNCVLWPVFQYDLGKLDVKNANDGYWDDYVAVNQLFVEKVMKLYEPGDIVWVHDYHLLLMPKMLREKCSQVPIGFFLHIPFPTEELYRVLPKRKELLEGLVACDLIGFHCMAYRRHFLQCCVSLLGATMIPEGISYFGRDVRVESIPIGITPEVFENCMLEAKTINRIMELKEIYKGKRIILGVDRVDYAKGLDNKLDIFKWYLEKTGDRDCVLVQIGIPTREAIGTYCLLKDRVNQLGGEISSQFGEHDFRPIVYLNRCVDMNELCALYALADVLLITSIRDGMNLVALEYIVCQHFKPVGDPGVLILSEFAGTAVYLPGSLLINPWNYEDGVKALELSKSMTPEQKMDAHVVNYEYVTQNIAQDWCEAFLTRLKRKEGPSKCKRWMLPDLTQRITRKTLFVITSSVSIQFLDHLLSDPEKIVIFMQPLRKYEMTSMYSDYPTIGLVAENGLELKLGTSESWMNLFPDRPEITWKGPLLKALSQFHVCIPKSRIIECESLILFDFSDADSQMIETHLFEIITFCQNAFFGMEMTITQEHDRIMFSTSSVTKERAFLKLLDLIHPESCVIIGSNPSDEKLFEQGNHHDAKTVLLLQGEHTAATHASFCLLQSEV